MLEDSGTGVSPVHFSANATQTGETPVPLNCGFGVHVRLQLLCFRISRFVFRIFCLVAFLGSFFDQAFRQENQPAHLTPFRDDIADDLSPFALGIHSRKKHSPANTGHADKHEKRMMPQEIQNWIFQVSMHRSALG